MMSLLKRIAPVKILDVGAGSAYFSRYLLARTNAQSAWCVDTSYAEDADQLDAGKAVHYRRSIDAVDADLVLLMDVLEHVDDDIALLSHHAAKVPRGAFFLVSVPAFQSLWSGHDVFLEHKRRYALHEVESLVRDAGLKVLCGNYYFGAIFPIAAATRMGQRVGDRSEPKSQLRKHHPVVNFLLGMLCKIELPFMRWNRIAGLTVFCLAVKD